MMANTSIALVGASSLVMKDAEDAGATAREGDGADDAGETFHPQMMQVAEKIPDGSSFTLECLTVMGP